MTGENRTDPKWARSRKGNFHRFIYLRPSSEGLDKVSGIYVVWHGGLKPEWITVGKSANLGRALETLADDEDVEYYENRGGVFVTWSQIRPEFQDGVLKYLIETLDLLTPPDKLPAKNIEAIPVYPPGLEPRAVAPKAPTNTVTPPS